MYQAAWTDSEVTLQWLLTNKTDITYVCSRVIVIKKLVQEVELRHVSERGNSAAVY